MVDKHEVVNHGIDVAAGLLAFSAFISEWNPILQFLIGLATLVLFSIRIWESKTIRKLTGRVENG
jgi:Sec-independent protein secretion pathway component TatC